MTSRHITTERTRCDRRRTKPPNYTDAKNTTGRLGEAGSRRQPSWRIRTTRSRGGWQGVCFRPGFGLVLRDDVHAWQDAHDLSLVIQVSHCTFSRDSKLLILSHAIHLPPGDSVFGGKPLKWTFRVGDQPPTLGQGFWEADLSRKARVFGRSQSLFSVRDANRH